MSLQTFQETLVAQSLAGTAFGTYTSAKTVIPPVCLVQLPPNYFYVGKAMRTTVWGAMSTFVTTPGTVVFQIMMGAIAVWSSGNIQMNATAHSLLPWKLVVEWRVDTIGNGVIAKVIGLGLLNGVMFTKTIAATDLWGRVSAADAAVGEVSILCPITTPAVGTGFDSTIANVMDFFVGFSVSNAANIVQPQFYMVEALN